MGNSENGNHSHARAPELFVCLLSAGEGALWNCTARALAAWHTLCACSERCSWRKGVIRVAARSPEQIAWCLPVAGSAVVLAQYFRTCSRHRCGFVQRRPNRIRVSREYAACRPRWKFAVRVSELIYYCLAWRSLVFRPCSTMQAFFVMFLVFHRCIFQDL